MLAGIRAAACVVVATALLAGAAPSAARAQTTSTSTTTPPPATTTPPTAPPTSPPTIAPTTTLPPIIIQPTTLPAPPTTNPPATSPPATVPPTPGGSNPGPGPGPAPGPGPGATPAPAPAAPAVTAPPATLPPTPVQLTGLVQDLSKTVAQVQAVQAYLAAQAAAAARLQAGGSTVTTAGATAPGGVDPVLIQVALGQLKAQAARNAAQQQYDQAHNRIASVAVALYLGEQLPDVTNPTSGSAAARSAFLAAILQEEQRQLRLANDALGIAEGIYNQSKQEADQLVNARAALLYASNVGPSGAARPSALAAVIQPIAAQRGPALSAGFSGASPTILGQAVLTPEEILGWYSDSGKQAHLTVPIAELVADYQRVGMADGVRWDIALAQSVVETGYFDFPSSGQVASTDNNFAGIGACDSCSHGFQYPDAATGVAAHLQLLHGYATPQPIPGPLTKLPSVAGCCPTWLALTGVWATATSYGFAILNTYRQMVVWALARRSAAAGL